jgi:hypothetical protein
MSQPAEQSISKESIGSDSRLGARDRDDAFTEDEIAPWIKIGQIAKRAKTA